MIDIFDLQTVSALRAMKGSIELKGKDLLKQVPISVTAIGKFKGDWETAPTFLAKYSNEIYKYNYAQPEAFSVLESVCVDGAKSWMSGRITAFSRDTNKINNMLFHILQAFISNYLS